MFPENTKTAIVYLLASESSAQKFWYTNVSSEYVVTYPSNPGWLYGYSPFRKVELLIDGQPVGVSWLLPLLFSEGEGPEVVAPSLPILYDGKANTFGIKAVGYNSAIKDNVGTIGENCPQVISSHLSATPFSFHPTLSTFTTANTTTAKHSPSPSPPTAASQSNQASTGRKSVSWHQSIPALQQHVKHERPHIQPIPRYAAHRPLYLALHPPLHIHLPPKPLQRLHHHGAATLSSVFALIDCLRFCTALSLLLFRSGKSFGTATVQMRQHGASSYYWNNTIVKGTSADDGLSADFVVPSAVALSVMPGEPAVWRNL
ncbi:hypothetical protein BJ878DRAFT_476326 [Calycina marina]|uniref:Peptide N-acetyl-beta-D-glucosaminyl asparaginase amidase A N-terminal domain-containing protein n=1 Tax=Calycina marina TaxID=1763456 RepID=A0A9P7ZB36_9HELO|nr:hypothetical protein BJ878DRAFT_476326 [Calycina marina]